MPNPREIATISVGGMNYSSWKSLTVHREVGQDAAFSFFQFTASEAAVAQGDVLKIKPYSDCTITLGGALVLTGTVMTRLATYDKESHDLIVAGYSQVHHLQSSVKVDAQTSGLYDGYTFEQAVRGVIAPHPVQLVMKNAPDIASKPFPNLVVQLGESVLEFADRIRRMRGMLLTDDENGNLVASLADGSSSGARLVEGQNILRASAKLGDTTLFSSFSVPGQQPSTDDNWPARPYSATAQNPDSPFANKIQIHLAEHPGDPQDMQARANLLAQQSSWPCVEVEATVQGWFRPDGQLWQIYDVIPVQSPMLFPTADGSMSLGIRAVTFAQDGGQEGTTTTLSMTKPEGLTPLGGNPDVKIDAKGGFIDNVLTPAQPDAPDYQAGIGR